MWPCTFSVALFKSIILAHNLFYTGATRRPLSELKPEDRQMYTIDECPECRQLYKNNLPGIYLVLDDLVSA